MQKKHIEQLLLVAMKKLLSDVGDVELPKIQAMTTKDKLHGDYTTNVAFLLAKKLKENPLEIATKLKKLIPVNDELAKIEIAGPGFINFFLFPKDRYALIEKILLEKEKFGTTNIGQGKRVLVEFVSSNPTGPLHVGHGRHGAYGSVVANLLSVAGFEVYREYYVNDAGRQVDVLALSVWLRYLAFTDETIPFPDSGYCGDYIYSIARDLQTTYKHRFIRSAESVLAGLPKDIQSGGDAEIYVDACVVRMKELLNKDEFEIIANLALDTILTDIRADLAELGVTYDNWFSEKEFVQSDVVSVLIERLKANDLTYKKDQALWFCSTRFGDDKDRVLQRSNGIYTYFANDLAYHVNKFARGFEKAIDIFGADHHGYIPRMKAGLQAFGIGKEKIQFQLTQFVTLFKGGKQLQMSTRKGSFVTLRQLRDEVGNDATRFFYLMRKSGQHVDFDMDLAKSQSNDNPVYYVQYAYARICSVFRQLTARGLTWNIESLVVGELELLQAAQEEELLIKLSKYPQIILQATLQYEPQILVGYMRELANAFHSCYNACPFLVEDVSLRNARLALVAATKQVLTNGLKLLHISAPESM